jgi:hypothetical protein
VTCASLSSVRNHKSINRPAQLIEVRIFDLIEPSVQRPWQGSTWTFVPLIIHLTVYTRDPYPGHANCIGKMLDIGHSKRSFTPDSARATSPAIILFGVVAFAPRTRQRRLIDRMCTPSPMYHPIS